MRECKPWLDWICQGGKAGHVERRAELWRAAAFADFWEQPIRPWLERLSADAIHDSRATVVVTPSRGIGHELKRRFLECGPGALGIHFWTPGDLRQHMVGLISPGRKIASREFLHLLLAQSAASCIGAGLASAVSFDPAILMRALDELAAAGWDWTELDGGEEAQSIIREFERRLTSSGFCTVQACDWALLKAVQNSRAWPLRAVLIHGFSGANWPIFPLLLAAARSAEDALVTMASPRRLAEKVDQIWIGSWEQHLDLCTREVEGCGTMGRFQELAESLEAGHVAARGQIEGLDFEICEDAAAEARAILGRTMTWLAAHASGHIAVVFQRAGVVSREVGRLLDSFGVPHDDALGFRSGHAADEAAWREWLLLQTEWTAGRLARFLVKRPRGLWPLPDQGHPLLDRLRRMEATTLDGDLDLLRPALAASGHVNDSRALGDMGTLRRVPERGAFDELVKAAAEALEGLGWGARSVALLARARPLAQRVEGVVRRGQFLAWVESAMDDAGRERRPTGGEPHARIHLVSARDAEAQYWDAVILAGMNMGEWPLTVAANAFLPDAKKFSLNGRALIQGRQGEGHETVAEGRGLILSDADWRYVGLRQCLNLIEGAGSSLCMTARLRGEEDPARILGPADLLVKAHHMATDDMLTDESMAAISLRSAARWSGVARIAADHAKKANPEWAGAGPREVREAWDARRSNGPFGPFDFCLRRAPARPLRLACKAWEDAWRYPSATWLREIMGVSPAISRGGLEIQAQSVGTWAHEWLARALNPEAGTDFVPAPECGEALSVLIAAAERSRARAASIFREAGRELPQLWESVWKRALWAARAMCEEALREPGGYIRTECNLPAGCSIDVGDGMRLHLSGRVDLIRAEGRNRNAPVRVIDFKTGSDITLSDADLEKGKGLQVMLYGEALRELGAGSISLCIVRPGEEGIVRGISREEAASLLRALVRMQESGAFGVRGAMFSEFAYCPPLPMAVLPIPAEINDFRWGLMHGFLGGAEA